MIKILLFLSFSLTTNEEPMPQNEPCFQLFKNKKYANVIEQCSSTNFLNLPPDQKFIVKTSELFLEVSYERINTIFYATLGGRINFLRTENTSDDIGYTEVEKQVLNKYFSELERFKDTNIPLANLLLAKLFYINDFFEHYNDSTQSVDSIILRQELRVKYYLQNLEKYLILQPVDSEVLYLLGMHGLKHEQVGSNLVKPYFSVINPKYYNHLLKAAEMNHPKAMTLLQGVKNWEKFTETMNQKAESHDPESLYKLGLRAFYKRKHSSKEFDYAIDYFSKAGEEGHIPSLQLLSSIYKSERKNKEDYLKIINRLVSLKSSDGMMQLGDYYACNRNLVKGREMYNRAKSLNDPLAEIALDDLDIYGEPSTDCEFLND